MPIHLTTAGRLLLCSAMHEVFFVVSCLCATEGARHEPHAATGAERLVVLLLHVIWTQRSATDAAGAVGHKHLGTVLTDVTGRTLPWPSPRAHSSLRRRHTCRPEP